MISKKYDLAVVIGRFQPLHNGHLSVLKIAKDLAHETLVLVGSANTARSPKNPFSYDERQLIIQEATEDSVLVAPLNDYTYEENQWITDVQEAVGNATKVCIIGHIKDNSSYYLKIFPQWDLLNVDYEEVIDATQIRELMYESKLRFIEGAVPTSVMNFLTRFTSTQAYLGLVEEYKYNKKYKADWARSPHPPTFNTVDAVVIQSGHILLVKRKHAPGKGLWALPGGFINQGETQTNAVIRELREETKIKVPEPVLRGSIIKEKTFGAPNRSERGRTFTQAYLFQLDNSQELPKVKGSDDAYHAEFITLARFYGMAEEFFEDHYHIVRKLVDNM